MLSKNTKMDESTPLEFYLSQNYPNPFKERTVIKFCIPYITKVQLNVYNSDGKIIEKLVDEEKEPGTYAIEFSSDGLSSYNIFRKIKKLPDGYYFYRLKADNYTSEKKWFCKNGLL